MVGVLNKYYELNMTALYHHLKKPRYYFFINTWFRDNGKKKANASIKWRSQHKLIVLKLELCAVVKTYIKCYNELCEITPRHETCKRILYLFFFYKKEDCIYFPFIITLLTINRVYIHLVDNIFLIYTLLLLWFLNYCLNIRSINK